MAELISPRSCRRMMFWCMRLSGVAMRGTLSTPPDKRLERPVPPGSQRRLSDAAPPAPRKSRLVAGAFTAAIHAIVFAALFWPRAATPPSHIVPPPLQVSLLETPKPMPPAPPEPAMLQPDAADAAPPHLAVRAPTPSPFTVPDTSDLLSNSQLAGAATVGEGGGGGGSMRHGAGRAAGLAARSHGARGRWKTPTAQARPSCCGTAIGCGRAGRMARACRRCARRSHGKWPSRRKPAATQRMHGLVLLSLADGSTRFAVGAGDWRWSDLLGVNGAP